MTRHVTLREFLLAIEGAALGRHLLEDDESAAARVAEVRRIMSDEEAATYGASLDVPELDVRTGYSSWSTSYDAPGNPLICVEEPAVRTVLDEIAPGRALDAACGTGRQAAYLAARGHQVLGSDLTRDMLRRALANGAAMVAESDLRALPFPPSQFDLVVCSLALMHLEDLGPPIAELARVVRPGGRVVLSDMHPSSTVGGGQAFFQAADGRVAFVRQYLHLHGDYLAAFAASGLDVRRCVEPRIGAEALATQRLANAFVPDATAAALLGAPGALVWDLARR